MGNENEIIRQGQTQEKQTIEYLKGLVGQVDEEVHSLIWPLSLLKIFMGKTCDSPVKTTLPLGFWPLAR